MKILETRKEFVESVGEIAITYELAKSLFKTTKADVFDQLPNEHGWLIVSGADVEKYSNVVKTIDEKIANLNRKRLESGRVGGRPMKDELQGTPEQVKARLAKRRSREKIYAQRG
jgi:hypothetical protein